MDLKNAYPQLVIALTWFCTYITVLKMFHVEHFVVPKTLLTGNYYCERAGPPWVDLRVDQPGHLRRSLLGKDIPRDFNFLLVSGERL